MYESLALAMEAAGSPRDDVERALLSAVDFASSSGELLQLANYLARSGFDSQAIRVCRRVTRGDPANREAYALAMAIAARTEDVATLRWACPGVLAHEWPAGQQEVATRAARLAKATIDRLRASGMADEADAFKAAVDRAFVRDVVIDLAWTGDADIDIAIRRAGMTMRNRITWHETFGVYCHSKFGRCSRPIFYATKDSRRFTFNRDAVLVPSARYAKYGDRRAASDGKKIMGDVWQVSRVCGTFRERIKGVPTQLPEELVRRIVGVSSNPGDSVLDPFAGSGTVCAVAVQMDRDATGIELNPEYGLIAAQRIMEASRGMHSQTA
jgi:hypothetical protein